MIIELDEKKRLRSEKYCWVLEQKGGVDARTGCESYTGRTYHANVYQAIKYACNSDIRAVPDILGFEEAMLAVQKTLEKYKGILETIK